MATRWQGGYWANDDMAPITVLVGAAVGPLKWRDGKLRDANNALVVTTVTAGGKLKGGRMRDSTGALIVANPGVGPFKRRDGDWIDSNGSLVITAWPGSGQIMRQGYLRVPSGPLVMV